MVEYCHGGDLSSYIKSLKKDGGSFHDDIQGRHYNLLSTSRYIIIIDKLFYEAFTIMLIVMTNTEHKNIKMFFFQ